MRFALVIAGKDLRRLLADRVALGGWLGIPVLLGLLVAALMGGAPADERIAIHDPEDALGRLLALGPDPDDRPSVASFTPSRAEALARLRSGAADAALLVPADLEAAFGRGAPVALELYVPDARALGPTEAEERVRGWLSTLRVLRHAAGPELAQRASDQGAPEREALLSSLGPTRSLLEEPAARAVTAGVPRPPAPSFLPGLLLMALLLAAAAMADDVWAERASGTLRRVLAAPRGAVAVVAGKLLAGGAASLGISALALAAASLLLGVPLAHVAPAAGLATLAGVAMLALLFLAQIYARTRLAGRLLSTLMLFPLLMLGGSFFPMEQLPSTLASPGRLTPNGMVVDALSRLLAGTAPPAALATPALVLAATAVLAGAAATLRLHGRREEP